MNFDTARTRLCRLCQCQNDVILFHIFTEANVEMVEEIRFLIRKKPRVYDALPPYVCHKCRHKLKSYKEFRKTCMESFRELERKYVKNNEDDDVIILDERPCATPVPCSSKSSLADSATSDGESVGSACSSASHVKRSRKRYRLHNSETQEQTLVRGRQHSPDTSNLMRQIQRQYMPEILTKTRKLQHGLVGEAAFVPTSPEILPEVVDVNLGTKGFMSQKDSLQENVIQQSRRGRTRSPGSRRAALQSSFSDTEGAVLGVNRHTRCVLCNKVCENIQDMREHLVTVHGSVSDSEVNHATHSQPHMHRPLLSFSEQPLNRSHTEILSRSHTEIMSSSHTAILSRSRTVLNTSHTEMLNNHTQPLNLSHTHTVNTTHSDMSCTTHTNTVNRTHTETFACSLCPRVFTNRVMLRQHLLEKHQS